MSEEFNEYIKKYHALLLALIRRYYGGRFVTDYEDLAQEIWLKLWKSTQTHENSIRDFKSYLYRTVQTTLWETVQQLDKRPEVALEDQLVEPSEASPEKAILRKALLEKRMKQLKPQEQELMQLHFTGMTYKEIALLMRLEPGRVRNLLTRVKRKLEANDAS